MATTITNTTIQNTARVLEVVSNLSEDGVGVTDGVLVDKSTFTGLDGTEPGRFVIEKIEYVIDGFNLLLEFEHATDSVIANLTGQGILDFTDGGTKQGFVDPQTDATGDIVVTTTGHTAGDKATIKLILRKKD